MLNDGDSRRAARVGEAKFRPAGHGLITEKTPFVDVVLVPRSEDTSSDAFRLEERIDLGSQRSRRSIGSGNTRGCPALTGYGRARRMTIATAVAYRRAEPI